MPVDLVGAFARQEAVMHLQVQALSRSTICRFPFALQEAQLRQPTLAQGLLQAIAHQTAQTQRQITRTDLPALTRFGMLIKDISIHHNKQNLSVLNLSHACHGSDISDFIALAPDN